MSARRWFLGSGPLTDGPFSDAELRTFAKAGRITPETELTLEGREKPLLASRVQGLFAPITTAIREPVTTQIANAESTNARQEPGAETPAQSPQDVELPAIPSWAPPSVPAPEADQRDSDPFPNDPLAESLGLAPGTSLFQESAPSTARSERPQRTNPPTRRIGGTGRVSADSPLAPTWNASPPSTGSFRAPQPGQPGAMPVRPFLPLGLPPWRDLWPLVALVSLGWIGGSLLGKDRAISDGDGWIVFLLMIISIPASIVTFWFWLRPRNVPLGTAIGTGLFTAIGGVLTLLALQWAAALATGVRIHGRALIFLFVLIIIGLAYNATYSDSFMVRWVGFIFGVGLCEEAVKLLPLAYLLHGTIHRRIGLHGFVALGFISGLGFGVTEALYIYNPWSGMPGLDANLIRWFAVMPTHGFFTAASAAALWKLGDHLKSAEGFWGKTAVIALAAGGMAVVHGTYDAFCSLGIIPAMLMDGVSLVVLSWWVRHCSAGEEDPPETIDQPIVRQCRQPKFVGIMLGVAAAASVLVFLPSTDQTTAIRSRLPPEFRPFIDGMVMLPTDDEGMPSPHEGLRVRYRYDFEQESLLVEITNLSDQDLMEIEFTATTVDGDESEPFSRTVIAAQQTNSIDPESEWFFEPGERLNLHWHDHPDNLIYTIPQLPNLRR
jgi:RsiW-degrading membrane proteinase PrsW (M82 family)